MAFRHRVGWYLPLAVVLASAVSLASAPTTTAEPEPDASLFTTVSVLDRTVLAVVLPIVLIITFIQRWWDIHRYRLAPRKGEIGGKHG